MNNNDTDIINFFLLCKRIPPCTYPMDKRGEICNRAGKKKACLRPRVTWCPKLYGAKSSRKRTTSM